MISDLSIHISGFLVCATIIFFAGKRLSYYGNLMAELSSFGKAWIGLILMAAVTSLPELMVGISSTVIVQSADLAVGDILGSCAFNLGVLSMMDIFTPKNRPLFSHISRSHILAAAFGIILIALAGLSLFLDKDIVISPFVGLSSFSFFVVYLIAVKSIFNYQQGKESESEYSHDSINKTLTLMQVVIRYAFFALIIVLAALTLPYFSERISDETGLGKSFVGTLFLAASTSLPEIAVSLAAIRMGATDMAVGNLLGSNLFNVFILFLDDVFYAQGHLLKDASDVNLLSAFFVIMMTGIAIIGFIFPNKEKKFIMAWDTFTIFSLYLINMTLLYFLST